MGFWIFGNKKEGKEAHERIDQVHRVLKNSFENVKEDIQELGDWQRTLEMSHKEHKYKLEDIHQRLKRIENYIFSLNNLHNQKVESTKQVQKKEIEELEDISDSKDVLNILTATQVNMFIKLYQLQKQVGSKISYKSLASILYKDKNYNEVRSTLSEYISFLVDHDLVKKYRKGKESYAGITERGLELLEKLDQEEIDAMEKIKKDD